MNMNADRDLNKGVRAHFRGLCKHQMRPQDDLKGFKRKQQGKTR